MLKRFWFRFAPSSTNRGVLNLGCGVTAFDYDDAVELLKSSVFRDEPLPQIVDVIEDVDVQTLDQKHVVPNMGTVVHRGVWFPKIH